MRILLKVLLSQQSLKRNFITNNWKGDAGKYERIYAPGQVSKERIVPQRILKPQYYYNNMPPGNTIGTPEIKNIDQIQGMRLSGQLAANILQECGALTIIGKSTDEIDAHAHELILEANAYPSPLRYAGFPKSICTSINNVACHGIPDDRQLIDGDIINIDVTVYLNGYHGDCSETFLVGNVDEHGRYLVEATRTCLDMGISLCGPDVAFNKIGKFIQQYCKEKKLESIVAFIGHGIGSYFHGPPEIYHYHNNIGGKMRPGMTFTIEPILTLGESDIALLEDGWTAISLDGARSAQFEHTILITEAGAEILTKVH
ncbi:methionine aminopeptidase 1D, mitochondrial [Drosophila obscura]|uniref:methionine aminopeptidase 1D, mitochondrial n=1 Tax=Drosophila obscura TaxID=7282 RepID=UPI001BB2B564|nr:methionine aminopeptidase 1D, mitochondrial [Drosophila obscura]